MFESLQARLTYLFAAFVLLVVVSIGAMMWGSETQRQDAVLINLAGRQRMLAQQMARLAFEGEGKGLVASTLLEAEQLFDHTQRALLEGGAAPYPSGVPVTLPATRDLALRSALDQTGLAWNDFRTLLDQSQQAARAGALPASTLNSIEASASILVERADAVVRLYEATATAAEFQRMSARVPEYLTTDEEEWVDLIRRELETLSVAARGASDKEIAEELCISLHTVKSHMRSILSKLHVNTRREAARVAWRRGLL